MFINQVFGSTENGVYAFANKFSSILLQIAGIINMTMIEDAIQSAGNENWTAQFEKNISMVTDIFFRISLVLVPLIGLYYQTVSNSDFSRSLILVPFLIFATILTNTSTLIVLAQVLGSLTLMILRYVLGRKIKMYVFDWRGFILNSTLLVFVSTFTLSRNVWVQLTTFAVAIMMFTFWYRTELKFVVRKIFKYISNK